MKGFDFMSNFRPLSVNALSRRIVRRIPEINSDYVFSVLVNSGKLEFDERDVLPWIIHFENELYGKNGGDNDKSA